MLSDASHQNIRSSRGLVVLGLGASLLLTSCTAEQARLASLRPAPYIAINAGSEPSAKISRSGSFAEENGCVIFRPADNSPAVTPVFPKGETALATDGSEWLGLFVKGSPVGLGQIYRLSGAPESRGGGVSLATSPPSGCPSTYFVVRSVGKAVADASASRFCAGVTLCRSFSLE
jgi:hypothetical protein